MQLETQDLASLRSQMAETMIKAGIFKQEGTMLSIFDSKIPKLGSALLFLFLSILDYIVAFPLESNISLKEISHNTTSQKNTYQETANLVKKQRILAILDNLFNIASDIEDVKFRIVVQAKIADALWEADQVNARLRLEKVFRSINSIDAEDNQVKGRTQDNIEKLKSELKIELLKLISVRDIKLAERLREIEQAPTKEKNKKTVSLEKLSRDLDFARVVADSNPEYATQLVQKSLTIGPDPKLIFILLIIRRSNIEMADRVFSTLLESVKLPLSFTDLSVLGMYISPPEEEKFASTKPFQPVNRSVIDKYIALALSAAQQQITTTNFNQQKSLPSDVTSMEYINLGYVLSIFNQYAPDKTSPIKLLLDYASQNLSTEASDLRISSKDSNPVDSIINEAMILPLGAQRDMLYVRAVMMAARNGDPERAISILDKIFDQQQKSLTESIVKYQIAVRFTNNKEPDNAYRYARDLPDLYMRTMAYIRIVQNLIEKKETDRATLLLNELEQSVTRADTTPEKAKELLLITESFCAINKDRAFETLRAAIGAINNSDFSYKDMDRSTFSLNQSRNRAAQRIKITVESLNLNQVFSLLTKQDFDRSIILAQSIQNRDASIISQLVACREGLASISSKIETRTEIEKKKRM